MVGLLNLGLIPVVAILGEEQKLLHTPASTGQQVQQQQQQQPTADGMNYEQNQEACPAGDTKCTERLQGLFDFFEGGNNDERKRELERERDRMRDGNYRQGGTWNGEGMRDGMRDGMREGTYSGEYDSRYGMPRYLMAEDGLSRRFGGEPFEGMGHGMEWNCRPPYGFYDYPGAYAHPPPFAMYGPPHAYYGGPYHSHPEYRGKWVAGPPPPQAAPTPSTPSREFHSVEGQQVENTATTDQRKRSLQGLDLLSGGRYGGDMMNGRYGGGYPVMGNNNFGEQRGGGYRNEMPYPIGGGNNYPMIGRPLGGGLDNQRGGIVGPYPGGGPLYTGPHFGNRY